MSFWASGFWGANFWKSGFWYGDENSAGRKRKQRAENYLKVFELNEWRNKQRELLARNVEAEQNKKQLALKKPYKTSKQKITQLASIEDQINLQLAIEYHLHKIQLKRQESEALALLLLLN